MDYRRWRCRPAPHRCGACQYSARDLLIGRVTLAPRLLEIGQRPRRVLQKAQRDKSAQELLFGILVADGQLGMVHQRQRLARIARRQRIARLDLHFVPPALRCDRGPELSGSTRSSMACASASLCSARKARAQSNSKRGIGRRPNLGQGGLALAVPAPSAMRACGQSRRSCASTRAICRRAAEISSRHSKRIQPRLVGFRREIGAVLGEDAGFGRIVEAAVAPALADQGAAPAPCRRSRPALRPAGRGRCGRRACARRTMRRSAPASCPA